MATKKATAKKSRKAPARRGVSSKARKPAGGLSARRKPAAAAQAPQGFFSDLSLPRMLAEIFGMKIAAPPARKNAR